LKCDRARGKKITQENWAILRGLGGFKNDEGATPGTLDTIGTGCEGGGENNDLASFGRGVTGEKKLQSDRPEILHKQLWVEMKRHRGTEGRERNKSRASDGSIRIGSKCYTIAKGKVLGGVRTLHQTEAMN